MTVSQRFWSKVAVVGNACECWIWTAGRFHDGYGNFKLNSRCSRAHRVAYELMIGAIPEGLHVDHLCRDRACVNPFHLEPVTQAENIRRGDGGKCHRDKTHCRRGHELSGDNLYVTPGRGVNGPQRQCRQCVRDAGRRYRDAHQEITS